MKTISRLRVISPFLIAAYLLVACGGTRPAVPVSAQDPKAQTHVVAFSGVVESMDGTQWTVGGQPLTLDPQVALDRNIAVGDTVKVEASVSSDGSVVVKKVESSSKDDTLSTPSSDASGTTDPASTRAPATAQNEIFGTVEAITADTITIDGVSYNLADFTEIKGDLVVGDQAKVHVIVNADGSSTIREIERSAITTLDDHPSNLNGSDDGPNHDLNDDHSNHSNGSDDGPNHASNDDHGGGNSGPSGDSN